MTESHSDQMIDIMNQSKTLLEIIDTTGEPNILAEIVIENKLVSKNDFTKIFKLGDVDLYVHKAHDEDSSKWFLVCSIPHLKELNIADLKYPITFDTQREMNKGFKAFDVDGALIFLKELISEIKRNNAKAR